MDEERLKILKMVEDGKLRADEAAKLLDALKADGEGPAPAVRRSGARWLRIRVIDDGNKVNVNVPLKLLDIAKRFLPSGGLTINGQTLDLDEVMTLVREGAEGKLVEVRGSNGEEVEIYVE